MVLRALAVRVVPPDENLPVLAVPAVQNSEIFEVGRASTLTNPAILRARKYPHYRTSKYCPYLQYPLDINPKLCQCTKYLQCFFSRIHSQVLGVHSQVLGVSVRYCCINSVSVHKGVVPRTNELNILPLPSTNNNHANTKLIGMNMPKLAIFGFI